MKEVPLDRTGPLRHEHQVIKHRLNLLSEQVNKVRSGKVQTDSMEEIRKSISTLGAALKSHFENEERGLYESLEDSLGRDSPTEGMIDEHRAIYRLYKQLVDTLGRREVEPAFIRELKTGVDSLQRMVSEHIAKEEKVLFWIAEVKL